MQILYEVDYQAAKTWSLIDSKPVLVYVPHCDDYIIYWNGVALPHKMALALAMRIFCKMGITPEMRTSLEENYRKIYFNGGFGHRNWDNFLQNNREIYPFLYKRLFKHIESIKDTPRNILLGWFDYTKAVNNQPVISD